MGGNIFESRRFSKKEYMEISTLVTKLLKENFNGEFLIPLEIKEKEDFGDIDILATYLPTKEEISNIFNTNQVVRRNMFLSFLFKGIQIDLIYVEPEDLNYSFHAFSFGELNGLLGVITKRIGIKLSSKGIFYIKQIGGQNIPFLLSKDYFDIFDIIKIPNGKQIFKNALKGDGLKSYNEIFEFVTSSEYFNPSYFYMENFNAKHRARNKKRTMFMLFEKYLRDKGYTFNKDKEESYGDSNSLKEANYSDLIKLFPSLPKKIQDYEEEVALKREARKERLRKLNRTS